MTEPLFPLFLRLSGRRVLVVGAGVVAERKVTDLLDAGADVRVVAPKATPALRALARSGAIAWARRGFVARDVAGAWLVFAATDDDAAQARVARACAARSTFCVAVDDVANATAFGGSIVRRPPFLVAISSSGAAPALTRLVREVIEHVLPAERWVARATALRARWKRDGTPMGERFGALVRAMVRAR